MSVGKTIPFPTGASSYRSRVLYADTDQMGVANHGIYFRWFEAARAEFMRRRGTVYAEIESAGLHFPVVETLVKYRSPARYDEVIEIFAWLSNFGHAQFRFEYAIKKEDVVLAEGYTHHAVVSGAGKPVRMPVDIKQALLGPEIARGKKNADFQKSQ